MAKNNQRPSESGNALFIILIGVVLFAALAFTFTKGGQQGGDNINQRQAELATSDIITYAQRTSRAVDGMLRNGKSETDISFEGMNGPYANAACTDNSCKVFTGNVSGIQAVYPMSDWINSNYAASYAYMNWYISSQFCVPGVPDNICAAPKGNDLVMILPYLKKNICDAINAKLGLPNPAPSPSSFGAITSSAQFDGSYAPSGGVTLWNDPGLSGKSAGCLSSGGTYFFYQVLIAR